MSSVQRVSRLCSVLLYRAVPPSGGAAILLSCRHRLPLHQAVYHSDSPEGGNRENAQGGHEAAGVTETARDRLLRRAWGRSLSPMDRLSRMIPPEFISKEVQELQGPEMSSPQGEKSSDQVTPSLSSSGNTLHTKLEDVGVAAPQDKKMKEQVTSLRSPPSALERTLGSEPEDLGNLVRVEDKEAAERTTQPQPSTSPLLPPSLTAPEVNGDLSPSQGAPFAPGELLLAEYKRRQYNTFKKIFVLKQHGKLISNWGAIRYQDIVGKLSGQRFQTTTGHRILLKRASLEEYVLSMKRGPNICYPKDIAAMLMRMDISPGDVVLEAGSGSGACSLFLSRAVGSDGCVYSFEVRADHHEIAKKNFSTWRKAWQIRGRTWPENVHFFNKSIMNALPDFKSVAFDAAVLDMLHPYLALPVITRNLKQGAVCVVYIANVTQVIDLLEGIRCCKLPLICENIIEVNITNWLVAPSVSKDGTISKKVDSCELEKQRIMDYEEDDDVVETSEDVDCPDRSEAFGKVPYIARALPWQIGHTAFLVQLRKINPALPTEKEDSS